MGNNPYYISVSNRFPFRVHRHPEIELSYCIEGACDILCENKLYSLTTGDYLVIPPMAAHELPPSNRFGKVLTVNVGYALLGEYFETFTGQNIQCLFCKKSELQNTEAYEAFVMLLEETAALHCSGAAFCELSVKGNLYKISAVLLQMFTISLPNSKGSKKMTDLEKIDLALDKIYRSYSEPLKVEEVSNFCGYSKSNFCKIFKTITGDTFHNTLNRHRIEVACLLLRETNYTVEKIARETGFADAKSFCRVFKKQMCKSAGEYRGSVKRR